MSENRISPVTTDVSRSAIEPLLRRHRRDVVEYTIDPEYANLRDRRLAATLASEDVAEVGGLDPLERLTCRTHRRWVHECVSSPDHVFVVTGHRWCRQCRRAADVAVDQLTWNVAVSCPSCGSTPPGAASQQIVRTCRASLAASRGE